MNNREYSTPVTMAVPCLNSVSEGTFWRVPVEDNMRVITGYRYLKGEKPSADAQKVIRIKDNEANNVYFVAVADDATDSLFDEKCDICCGQDNKMPAVVIPDAIIEEKTCPDDAGNYVYFDYAPAVAAGEVLTLAGTKNGAVMAPAAPNEGFADTAALKAWANANWDGYGAFDVVDGKVTFTSDDAVSGSIDVSKARAFKTAAAVALQAGETYQLTVVADGVQVGVVTGATLAAVVTAAEASASLANLGKYAVTDAGTKIQLTTVTVGAAVLTLANVAA